MIDIGVQVVCIKDGWNIDILTEPCTCPVVGQVLTVRAIIPAWSYVYREILDSLHFEEIINPPAKNGYEPAFAIHAFRPVKKTSIDTFTEILKKAPSPVKETV